MKDTILQLAGIPSAAMADFHTVSAVDYLALSPAAKADIDKHSCRFLQDHWQTIRGIVVQLPKPELKERFFSVLPSRLRRQIIKHGLSLHSRDCVTLWEILSLPTVGFTTLYEFLRALTLHNWHAPEVKSQGTGGRTMRTIAPAPAPTPAPMPLSPAETCAAFLASLTGRDQFILRERLCPSETDGTLQAIGDVLRVTRERVRQLAGKLEKRFRGFCHKHSPSTLQVILRLRNEIGLCSTLEEVATHLLAAGIDAAVTDTHSGTKPQAIGLTGTMLINAAGSYQFSGAFIMQSPTAETRERIEEAIEEAAPDGVCSEDELATALAALDVSQGAVALLLASTDRIKRVGNKVVLWEGSTTERAVRYLKATSKPAAFDQIAALFDASRGSVRNALLYDQRICRTSKSAYGLREWGLPEYTSITDAITAHITSNGGASSRAHIIATLCQQYGVSEVSVNAYLSTPKFEARNNIVTLAPQRTNIQFRDDLSKKRNFFCIKGRWFYRLTVTAEQLRGSGTPLPVAARTLFGLRPGDRRSFSACGANISVSWPNQQPTIGTVRNILSDLKAAQGDYLFLSQPHKTEVQIRFVSKKDAEAASGYQRALLLAGVSSGDNPRSLPRLAEALGLPKSSVNLLVEVRTALQVKGQDDILSTLPLAQASTTPITFDIEDIVSTLA